ncbi:hypothetical protein BC941DRAFT_458048 [Chlamydoabsidia padenii]|nr:hypothetical protein BC941DRAFT_458048 [Chlamydoabsidia padenii]
MVYQYIGCMSQEAKAMKMFEHLEGTQFRLTHCYRILSSNPANKAKALEKDTTVRSRPANAVVTETPTSSGNNHSAPASASEEFVVRPIGRKQTKANKRKAGGAFTSEQQEEMREMAKKRTAIMTEWIQVSTRNAIAAEEKTKQDGDHYELQVMTTDPMRR